MRRTSFAGEKSFFVDGSKENDSQERADVFVLLTLGRWAVLAAVAWSSCDGLSSSWDRTTLIVLPRFCR